MPAAPAAERVAIGPTWSGEWPERSIGPWIEGWARQFLLQPDGPDAGQPWEFTDEQRRFIDWWYAVDEQGRFVHRYGMLRRVKGWGKDPIGAIICSVEFVGPCRVERVDGSKPGGVVPKQHPSAWVMVAAVARDQTRTTMTLFPSIFSERLKEEEHIDLGKELIYAGGGRRRIEAVTSSPKALEGPRTTFTLKNETQHWLSNNEGHKMAEVISRNATKGRDASARVLALSNAHEPGEDSDAEHDWEAWQALEQGRSRARGFMYDSLEAPPDTDLVDEESLRRGLREAQGDSVWLDIDRHVDEIHDPRNSASTSRRFYLNQLTVAEDAWIAPHEWNRLHPKPLELPDETEVTLGFDGSLSDDHSVLWACEVETGDMHVLGAWDPAEYDGEAPRDVIDGTVRRSFERLLVQGFFSDLHPWESYVDAWARDFSDELGIKASPKHPIAWDMRTHEKDFTIECERVENEIREQKFRHDGNPRAAQHVYNARRRPNTWGVSVGKEHRASKRKIDAVPALVLARMSRRLLLTTGKRRKRRSGKAAF